MAGGKRMQRTMCSLRAVNHRFILPMTRFPERRGEEASVTTVSKQERARVDTKNPKRGPLLIISGAEDHTVPWSVSNASFKREKRNEGVTEIVKMPERGHALTIDNGWKEVAETALGFIKRFL